MAAKFTSEPWAAGSLAIDSQTRDRAAGPHSGSRNDRGALLLDLDGTLIRGGEAIPGAAEFLSRNRQRIAIISNNSSDTPETLALRLKEMGLCVPADRIFLAGVFAVAHLARMYAEKTVMILGTPALKALASSLGLVLSDHQPDIVLVGRDESFDYAKLAAAGNAVAAGARFYACNADLSHPGPRGLKVPETGSLTISIAALAGRAPDRVFGKPDKTMLEHALARMQLPMDDAIMIGDNPATDGQAALNAGIRFLEVGDHVGRSIADVETWLETSL